MGGTRKPWRGTGAANPGGQAGRRVDGCAGRWADGRQAGRQAGRPAGRQAGRQAGRLVAGSPGLGSGERGAAEITAVYHPSQACMGTVQVVERVKGR